jgi:hypothetical protein
MIHEGPRVVVVGNQIIAGVINKGFVPVLNKNPIAGVVRNVETVDVTRVLTGQTDQVRFVLEDPQVRVEESFGPYHVALLLSVARSIATVTHGCRSIGTVRLQMAFFRAVATGHIRAVGLEVVLGQTDQAESRGGLEILGTLFRNVAIFLAAETELERGFFEVAGIVFDVDGQVGNI